MENEQAMDYNDPNNPAYLKPGWGVDASYRTPSYAAPFRPQGFNGADLRNGVHNPSPTLGNMAASYFDTPPIGINEEQHAAYYGQSAQNPLDRTTDIFQTYVAPTAAMHYTFKASSALQVRRNNFVASGAQNFIQQNFIKASARFTGEGSAATAAKLAKASASAATENIFARGASSLTRGVGKAALGGWVSGGVGAFALEGTAAVAGLAAGMIIPFALAEGAVAFADATIFDQYTEQRQMATNLRSNFQNQMMGSKNASSPFGINARDANRIAGGIRNKALSQREFSTEDYAEITDYAARAGLLGSATVDKMVSKIEGIARLTSTVMRMGKVLEKYRAVEILEQLQMSGITGSSAIGNIANNSAIAGIGLEKYLSGVGAQASMMTASQGFMSGSGAIAGARSLSAFTMGRKSGLVSYGLLSLMGGNEGATQSATAGALYGLQNPYMKMVMYNQHLNGGAAGSMVDNLTKFGANAAANPVGTAGAMLLHSGAFGSEEMASGGMNPAIQTAMAMARQQNLVGPNGKPTAEQLAAVMSGMGMPIDQIRAVLEEQRIKQDPKTAGMTRDTVWAQSRNNYINLMKDNGQDRGIFTTPFNIASAAWRGTKKAAFNNIVSPVTDMGAGISDDLTNFLSSTNIVGFSKEKSRIDLIAGTYEKDRKDDAYSRKYSKEYSSTADVISETSKDNFSSTGLEQFGKGQVVEGGAMAPTHYYMQAINRIRGGINSSEEQQKAAAEYIDAIKSFNSISNPSEAQRNKAIRKLNKISNKLAKTGGAGGFTQEALQAGSSEGISTNALNYKTEKSAGSYNSIMPMDSAVPSIQAFKESFGNNTDLGKSWWGGKKDNLDNKTKVIDLATKAVRGDIHEDEQEFEELRSMLRLKKTASESEVKEAAKKLLEGQGIQNAAVATAYRAAKAAGAGETEAINLAAQAGNKLTGARKTEAHVIATHMADIKNTAQSLVKIDKDLKSGSIDYGTAASIKAGMSLEKAATGMAESVDVFRDTVNSFVALEVAKAGAPLVKEFESEAKFNARFSAAKDALSSPALTPKSGQ